MESGGKTMKSWNSLEEVFESLHNSNCEYIILRNYEELDDDNFYMSGHADIDFLTLNHQKFADAIGAYPRFLEDDGVHYKINIRGTEVIIDVRTVGDGYYDTNWQKLLLKTKILHDERFFIAKSDAYYYSLVYHAILQKKETSAEYLNRLNQMAKEQDIPACTEKEHLKKLEEYMIMYFIIEACLVNLLMKE